MPDHVMKWSYIPGALGTNEGYRLAYVQQVTNASVADDDTLTFHNVSDVIPLNIASEVATSMDFDDKSASGGNVVLTNAVTTAATLISGVCLIKE